MNTPNLWTIGGIRDHLADTPPLSEYADGHWAPARPLGLQGLRWRLKHAWLVFTGNADALVWEPQRGARLTLSERVRPRGLHRDRP